MHFIWSLEENKFLNAFKIGYVIKEAFRMSRFTRRSENQDADHVLVVEEFQGNTGRGTVANHTRNDRVRQNRAANARHRVAEQALLALSPLQKKFAVEYMKDFNGTQAAMRAGYSEKSAAVSACILLKNKKVLAVIDSLEKELSTRFLSTKERVLKEMSILAYSDIADYADANGRIDVTNLRSLPPQVTRAIKKVKMIRRTVTTPTGTTVTDEKLDFELYDKERPLTLMGKEVGLFKDRTELTGADGAPLIPTSPTTIVFDFGGGKKVEHES